MKQYLIPTSVALAMGWAAGFAQQGYTAKASVAQHKTMTVTFDLDAQGKTCVAGIVSRQACPTVDAELGEAGVCKPALHAAELSVYNPNNGKPVKAVAGMRLPGTWSAD
jgi:hypothetical protein